MLFAYEIKKIIKRITPILLLVFIFAIVGITCFTTGLAFNKMPEPVNYNESYNQLKTKINSWDVTRQTNMAAEFNEEFLPKYRDLTTAVYIAQQYADIVDLYNKAKVAYNNFYALYSAFINADSFLIHQRYYDDLSDIIAVLNNYFETPAIAVGNMEDYVVENIPSASWQGATMQEILDEIRVQKIDEADLTTMRNFLNDPQHEANATTYAIIRNQYLLAIAKNFDGDLAAYDGFADFDDVATCQNNLTLAEYQLAHPETNYAQPFVFGQIYNNGQEISLTDFIFTNLEMAGIPLILLVVILAACAFFTDTNQHTIITALATRRKRSQVLFSKILAVLVLSVVCLLLFTGLYALFGALFFNGKITNDILFLWNNTTPVVLAPINYLLIYLGTLILKFIPWIALCGLLSFTKGDPRVIVSLSLVFVAIVATANALLGRLVFYQYVPLQALDLFRYFGATLFISPTAPTANIWFTWPVLAVITVFLYWRLLRNFRKKDF